ncbi:hypothetical protein [Formosa sp. PL04]|uniref:hypothetical protein n=1 Tax=Formosa sp. PL04 TaxID=3081755 RepID=UPI0029817C96|nr:hypothetical protein [Formosa sp. PL04]MDW5290501.1 hypothetical protein [Formosa sp. PL04]
MKTIITLLFVAFSYVGYAQLIDPFGKVVTHEIKLEKLKNGMYAGAMEWTTGGIDSLQRFVITGLDVKAPVLVRIISKAPDHNIDLSFHKKNWDKVESKVSTNGDKFVDKIFRTMNIVGIGVRSEVAGIPYLISVKVGLQFPSTQSLIRITDNKEEYTQHMRKMGFTGQLFEDDNNSSGSNAGINNTLTYIVIGLLAIITILLVVFLLKRKAGKHIASLLILLTVGQFCIAQSSQPKLVPVGDSGVFLEYRTSNVTNQAPIAIDKPRVRDTNVEVPLPEEGGFVQYRPVRIESNPGSVELSESDAAKIRGRMDETDENFNTNYGEDSPGEPTEGDQRTLPVDRFDEELDQLRAQVLQLQQQVDLLSQEDEAFDSDSDAGGGALLYCEDLDACQGCVSEGIEKFNRHVAYWNFLQKFYLKEVDDLNDKIEYGNTLASMPSYGIAWGPILTTVIRPAMNNLKAAYNKKFDEYINSIEADLEGISACYQGPNGRFRTNDTYEIQAYAIINSLKAARINK